VVRLISAKKNEPAFLLNSSAGLSAQWLKMEESRDWSTVSHPVIDYQALLLTTSPKQRDKKAALDEVDPKLLESLRQAWYSAGEQKRLKATWL